MPKEKIRELLKEAGEAAHDVAEEQRSLFEEISDDLARWVDGDESGLPDSIDALKDAVTTYEAEHPKLTSALNSIASMLSDIGL